MGELEPSRALINKFYTMQTTGELKHVEWSELTRRDKEVRCEKSEQVWKPDTAGSFKRTEKKLEDPAEVADTLDLKCALQRRGAAMHIAQLLSFEVH